MGIGTGALVAGMFGMNVSSQALTNVVAYSNIIALVDQPSRDNPPCIRGAVSIVSCYSPSRRVDWSAQVPYLSLISSGYDFDTSLEQTRENS